MSESRLLDRFARLCEIPSPTGSERAAADAVAAELRSLGVGVIEDGAAEPARAGAGNLVARIPGTGEGWVMFCAHLDTVPHDEPIEVELADGVFRSRGETILGADDKAAVAVLIELAARAAGAAPAAGIELAFTVAEEDGLRGAKELDLGSLRAPFGYVLDHASPIGELIVGAPTHQRLVAEFEGVEAHAGIRPEDGHSAIEAAAAAIGAMELGRLDNETTANVGVVAGGTATNVVAGRCAIECEARSLDQGRIAEVVAAMLDACTWGASEHGSSAATASRRAPRPFASRRRRCGVPATSRAASSPAAGATRTRSSPAGSTASCSPTAPRRTTPRRRASAPRG